MKENAGYFETSVPVYQTKQHNVKEIQTKQHNVKEIHNLNHHLLHMLHLHSASLTVGLFRAR